MKSKVKHIYIGDTLILVDNITRIINFQSGYNSGIRIYFVSDKYIDILIDKPLYTRTEIIKQISDFLFSKELRLEL